MDDSSNHSHNISKQHITYERPNNEPSNDFIDHNFKSETPQYIQANPNENFLSKQALSSNTNQRANNSPDIPKFPLPPSISANFIPNADTFNSNMQQSIININQQPNFYNNNPSLKNQIVDLQNNQNKNYYLNLEKNSSRDFPSNYQANYNLNRFPEIAPINFNPPKHLMNVNPPINSLPQQLSRLQQTYNEDENILRGKLNVRVNNQSPEKLAYKNPIERQIKSENLSTLISENMINLKDLEKHPHQFNFFSKAFHFLTVQISDEKICPQDMDTPYSTGYSFINELIFIKKIPKPDDQNGELKQFIYYETKEKEKFVLKRSSVNISLKDKNNEDVSDLINKFISEKYLEYSLYRLHSASPHSISVLFFNIILLDIPNSNIYNPNSSYTITEMLMEYGGEIINNNYILTCPECDQPAKLYDFFVQMCDCLLFLEQFRIEQNDIKIENVLVSNINGIALYKLIDFDIGNNQSTTLKTGNGMGMKGLTPTYAAPEIIQVNSNSQNSDQINPWKAQIYSLGIMILKLGGFPNQRIRLPIASSIDDLKHSEEKYSILKDKLNEYYNTLSDNLKKNIIVIADKCIEFNPNNRPTSFELCSLLKDLKNKNKDRINNEFKELQKLRISSKIPLNSMELSKNEKGLGNIKASINNEIGLNIEKKKMMGIEQAFDPTKIKIVDELKKQLLRLEEENTYLKSENQKLIQQKRISENELIIMGNALKEKNEILNENNLLKIMVSKLEKEIQIKKSNPCRVETCKDKFDIQSNFVFLLKEEINQMKNYSIKIEQEKKDLQFQNWQLEERNAQVESVNKQLNNSLKTPNSLLKILISQKGMYGNRKSDFENIQKFLENISNETHYSLSLTDYSKMKFENPLIKWTAINNDPLKLTNSDIKIDYAFTTPLQEFVYLLNSFIKFELLKNSKVKTIEELTENLNFSKSQEKMKELYNCLGIEKLVKEIQSLKLIENNGSNSTVSNPIFNGQLKYGRPKGTGYLIYANGIIYVTEFLDGKIANYCIIYKTNELYFGLFDPFTFNGLGFCLFIDPNVKLSREMDLYFGYFIKSKPHGFGKKIIYEKSVYTGNWEAGEKSGKGKLKFDTGEEIEGDWKFNALNGEGKYTEKDGKSYYKGNFEKGERTKGKYYFEDGCIYDGEWKDDEMSGNGKYIFTDSSYYHGEYLHNLKNGFGEHHYKDGSIYVGEFKDDSPNGKGKLSQADINYYYDGEFKDGKFNGQGILKTESGETYIGTFKEHQYNGKGKLIYADNSYYEGDFQNDKKDGIGIEIKNGQIKSGKWKTSLYVG